MGSRENPVVEWVNNLTPTGYSHVAARGLRRPCHHVDVDRSTMRIISGIGASPTPY